LTDHVLTTVQNLFQMVIVCDLPI